MSENSLEQIKSPEQTNSSEKLEKSTIKNKYAYFAGIDLGTSGCRLTVIDKNKKTHHQATITYQNPDKQIPQLWWDCVSNLLKALPLKIKQNLQSIAVDGTSGTILLVNSQGQVTSSVLMYNDLRATEEAEKINQLMPKNNGGQGASGSLARLLWLLKHEPSKKHAHAVHQADYILGKLSNNYQLSDENNCLKLGYDVVNQSWPKDKIKKLGVPLSLLPIVVSAGTTVAHIDPSEAIKLGLPSSLKCVTGTTDSIAAFIATGANKVGDAVTSLGSTLVLKLVSDTPIFSPEHGIYSHRLNNQWLVGGASNAGAKVLQNFFSQQQLDELTPQLLPDKTTGLDYYPLVKGGERFPVADANKQPKLSPRPKSDLRFFQGILEGIANIEKQGYMKLRELGAPQVSSVRSVGGGSKNEPWTQIRKNQLSVSMLKSKQTEASYGSALLALKGYNEKGYIKE